MAGHNLSPLALFFPSSCSSSSSFRCSHNGNKLVQAAEAERQRKIRAEEERKVWPTTIAHLLPSFSPLPVSPVPPLASSTTVSPTVTNLFRLPKRSVSARFEQKKSAELQPRCGWLLQRPLLLLISQRRFCRCLHLLVVRLA